MTSLNRELHKNRPHYSARNFITKINSTFFRYIYVTLDTSILIDENDVLFYYSCFYNEESIENEVRLKIVLISYDLTLLIKIKRTKIDKRTKSMTEFSFFADRGIQYLDLI